MTEHEDPHEGSGPEPAPAEGELEQAVEAAGREGRRALSELIHNWIPLGIAIVSVLAALMGWRASLAEESATHNEEISRQNLVQQQELQIQDNDAVNSDIDKYGQFAQFSGLAQSELSDASKVGGAVGSQLSIQGQADLGIARYTGKQISILNYAFDPSNPTGNPNLLSNGTLAPGHPYDAAEALRADENSDTALHGLSPGPLLETADHDRNDAVDLEGIAALFIAVMVLLTFGAIVTGTAKVWLATSGVAIAATAVVLFAVVEI